MKAIITGGTRGIGRAIAVSLLDHGFEVNVLARTLPPDLPESAVFWRTDLRDLSATLQTVDAIGTPSVLVNAAGFMNTKTAMEYDGGEIQDILEVNLINTVKLSLHVAKSMAKRPDGGRIISLGSLAGRVGHPDLWYAVAKAGLETAMRSLARAMAAEGVSCFTIAPGPVETSMLGQIPEERKARLKNSTIAGRFALPQEVAAVVLWLATLAPTYLSGDCIDLNNGMNVR